SLDCLAADSEREDPHEQPVRQRAAQHHGAPADLEYRQGVREMMFVRGSIVACMCAVTVLSGCRRAAIDAVEYKDEVARPEEPLIRQTASVGRHVCCFVLGTTVNP